jgi:hypothetical protein
MLTRCVCARARGGGGGALFGGGEQHPCLACFGVCVCVCVCLLPPKVAAAVAKLFPSNDDVKAITADASVFFPVDFPSVRVQKIAQLYMTAKEEKLGVAA